jgi:hypothetical protein
MRVRAALIAVAAAGGSEMPRTVLLQISCALRARPASRPASWYLPVCVCVFCCVSFADRCPLIATLPSTGRPLVLLLTPLLHKEKCDMTVT